MNNAAQRAANRRYKLAIGAALCKAFDQDWHWPYYIDHEAPYEEIAWSDWARDTFRPGHNLQPGHSGGEG